MRRPLVLLVIGWLMLGSLVLASIMNSAILFNVPGCECPRGYMPPTPTPIQQLELWLASLLGFLPYAIYLYAIATIWGVGYFLATPTQLPDRSGHVAKRPFLLLVIGWLIVGGLSLGIVTTGFSLPRFLGISYLNPSVLQLFLFYLVQNLLILLTSLYAAASVVVVDHHLLSR